MRHLVGVVLAIVLAAAVFFAASWGYLKLLIGPAGLGALPGGGGSLLHNHAVLEGFGALLGVGLIAGLLIAVAADLPARGRAGRPGAARLDRPVPVQRAARGPVHPAEDAALREGLRGHALRRGAGPGGPGHDHPAVHSVPVAEQARGDQPAALRGQHGAPSPTCRPPRPCMPTAACCPTGPDQAAAAGGPERPGRLRFSAGALGTRRLRLILPPPGVSGTGGAGWRRR